MNANQSLVIVEALIKTDAFAICLTPNSFIAHQIKSAFPKSRRLPLILPLPRLLAVASQIPNASLEHLLRLAPHLKNNFDDDRGKLLWAIYQQLKTSQKAPSLCWQLAKKLTDLFIEVNNHCVGDTNPFSQLESKTDEMNIAHIVWDNINLGKRALLARLAKQWDRNLIAVMNEATTATEEAFYQQCSAQFFSWQTPLDENILQSLEVDGHHLALENLSLHSWQGRAQTLTDTAKLALVLIKNWLQDQSVKTIGLVVYDRLLARRLRALCENENIFIQDATGWRVETLAFGAALRCFLRLAVGDYQVETMSDYLQSPFFAHLSEREQADALWRQCLDQADNLPADFYECEQYQANSALARLMGEINEIHRSRPVQAPLATWVLWLEQKSQLMLTAFEDDPLFKDFLSLLKMRSQFFQEDCNVVEFDWWVNEALTHETMSENNIISPIEFVSPGTQKKFSALLLLNSMSVSNPSPQWLSVTDYHQLGIPNDSQKRHQERRRFCQMITHHEKIAAIWRCEDDHGQEIRPNPFWDLFSSARQAVGDCEWIELPMELPILEDEESEQSTLSELKLHSWPKSLPVSAFDELMSCPYRFYIHHLSQFYDLPAADALSFAKRRGILLHQIMSVLSTWEEKDGLEFLSTTIKKFCANNRPFSKLWEIYWISNIPQFIKWKREHKQWKTIDTEKTVENKWSLPEGEKVVEVHLRGRLDCLSRSEDKQMITDYKSGFLPTKTDFENGERPQLIMYADLLKKSEEIDLPLVVSLCNPFQESRIIEVKDEGLFDKTIDHIHEVLTMIGKKIPLPANGALNKVCKSCDVAGVCRRLDRAE